MMFITNCGIQLTVKHLPVECRQTEATRIKHNVFLRHSLEQDEIKTNKHSNVLKFMNV